MKENVGRIDRIARFVVGPALAAVGYTRLGGRDGDTAGLAAMIAGAMILESAITRVCPFNALVHLDTRSRRERERDLQSLVEASRSREPRFAARGAAIGPSAISAP